MSVDSRLENEHDGSGFFDLVLVALGVAMAQGRWFIDAGSLSRFLVVLPLLLVLPGYVATLVLFPTKPTQARDTTAADPSRPSIDIVERLALAFGLSVAIVPVLGLGLFLAGVSPIPTAFPVLTVFVVFFGVVGLIRRLRTPKDRRYAPTIRQFGRIMTGGAAGRSAPELLVNVALGGAIVFAVGALAFGLAAPQEGETYTEFAVGDSIIHDQFIIGQYDSELTVGEETNYDVFIENKEGTAVTYTLVVQLERVEDGEVIAVDEQETQTVEVEAGESAVTSVAVAPATEAGDQRIHFQLRSPDHNGDGENRQSLFVWVTVRG